MPMQMPQMPSQQPLNESIEQTRALMQQMRGMPNYEAVIARLLQGNPQLGLLTNALRNGNSLEGIARSMASANNIDIKELIGSLLK